VGAARAPRSGPRARHDHCEKAGVLRFAWRFATIALTLTSASGARAAGGLLHSSQRTASLSEARVAVARSPGQTTRWATLRVDASTGAVAWLFPVRAGARVDEVGPSWMEALDESTAVRVGAPPCAAADGGSTSSEVMGSFAPTERALAVAEIEDPAALDRFAATWGFEEPAELRARFVRLAEQGVRLLALVYPASIGGGWTRTIRVTDAAAPAIPLLLTLGGERDVRVTAFVISEGRATVGSGPMLAVDPARLSWQSGSSNYAALRDELLAGSMGRGFVLEASGPDLLWSGARPNGAAGPEAPSVVGSYLARALASGDAPRDCAPEILALASSSRGVGRACARGELARVQAESDAGSCAEEPSGDSIDPSALRCGADVEDLALALSGLTPAGTWVTRVIGVVPTGEYGEDAEVGSEAGRGSTPFITAGRCADPGRSDAGAGGAGPGTGWGSAGAWAGDPAGGPNGPWDPGAGTEMPVDPGWEGDPVAGPRTGPASETYVEVSSGGSCSGSTEPQPGPEPESASSDSCDHSDTSDSTTSDDGCDGSGSTSPEQDEGEGCDGSSQSSDDPNGDSCDSSSGSSDSQGESCSGSSSGSASGNGNDCAVSRRRRRRTRTSAVTLALFAVIAPLRRLTRPRPRGPR
jgi:hypothetical protein